MGFFQRDSPRPGLIPSRIEDPGQRKKGVYGGERPLGKGELVSAFLHHPGGNPRSVLRRTASRRRRVCFSPAVLARPQVFGLKADGMGSRSGFLSDNEHYVTGPTGIGKTFICCALGDLTCRNGYSVRYRGSRGFCPRSTSQRGDGSYSLLMKRLAKMDLLILDDWGIGPILRRPMPSWVASSTTTTSYPSRANR